MKRAVYCPGCPGVFVIPLALSKLPTMGSGTREAQTGGLPSRGGLLQTPSGKFALSIHEGGRLVYGMAMVYSGESEQQAREVKGPGRPEPLPAQGSGAV